MEIFRGKFTKLRDSKYFEYYIIRERLLADSNDEEAIKRFVELEGENFEDRERIHERISIWSRIVVGKALNRETLTEEMKFLLERKYLEVIWELFVTHETLNLLNLYITYAAIIGELNTEKVALNILNRWKTQDIGSRLKAKFEYSDIQYRLCVSPTSRVIDINNDTYSISITLLTCRIFIADDLTLKGKSTNRESVVKSSKIIQGKLL